MHFYKYQGTGNDFVVVDDRAKTFGLNQEAIASFATAVLG